MVSIARLGLFMSLYMPMDRADTSNTRLTKLDKPDSPFAALILAISGLTRLGAANRITAPLSSPQLFHAVGQGALGVEIRSGDARTREAMRGMGHWPTEWRCGAERGLLRVLEGGCSVPVGIESELEELDPTEEDNAQDSLLSGQVFDEIVDESPMLWFSGIVDPVHPLPISRPPSPSGTIRPGTPSTLPPFKPRRARLTVRACVTSLDGTQQVVHSPPSVVVRNYQEAERWGELLAQSIKSAGGKDILDEVTRIRRERERRDLERAIEKSLRAANESAERGEEPESGTATPGGGQVHQGLQDLVKTLIGESPRTSRAE